MNCKSHWRPTPTARQIPPRAYSAEGRTAEHRSREAQRAACRSAAGRRSRPPLAAASAESEGPKSPIIRRERAAGFGGDKIVRTAPLLRCNTTSLSFDVRRGEAAASELPSGANIRGRIAPKGARPSTGPEKRSAPRAGPRLGGLSRPPRAAASAESEGPSSPLTRRASLPGTHLIDL